MKKFITILTALVVLAPAAAMAQAPELRAQVRAEGKAEAGASTTNRSIPKLGPAIKNIASTTRAELKSSASTTAQMMHAKVEAIKGLIEKKRADMKARADDARGKAKERFGERIEHLVGQVSNRLASTSAHLDAIADRIDTRIDTLQDEGYDMQGSIALLAEARADLSLANDKILAVNAALADAMSAGTTTVKAKIPAVRAAVKAAEDALKLVKDDLMETLRSIKVEASATTTISN